MTREFEVNVTVTEKLGTGKTLVQKQSQTLIINWPHVDGDMNELITTAAITAVRKAMKHDPVMSPRRPSFPSAIGFTF